MPSPIGHALGGVAVAWSADLADGRRSSPRLVAVCAGLGMLPDADLLFAGAHRTATHSITAAALTFIIAAVVTGQVTRCQTPSSGVRHAPMVSDTWRTAALCGLAYASHLLLDWLGADYFPPFGIQLLWPFSDRWFISNVDLFRQTARRSFLTPPIIRQNALAVAQEIAILAPILLVLWLVRVKTAARLAPEVTRRDHPAQ